MIRRLVFAVVLALMLGSVARAQGVVTLLDVPVTVAVTGVTASEFVLARLPAESPKYLAVQAAFTYGGSGGTNATAYVQTSLDAGVSWADVMSFQFTTSTATRVSAVVATTALAAAITPTDGALTANTILSGLLGDRIRVKYTTTGTYAGNLATGTVTYENGTAPTATKTLSLGLNGAVYKFVAVVADPGDVKVEATADDTLTNLSRAINAAGGISGAGNDYIAWDYGGGPVANNEVSASLNVGADLLTLTALVAGTAGNLITMATDETTFTLSGATLSGGDAAIARLKVTAVPR